MSSWEVSIETQEQSHERLIDKEIQQTLVFMQEHEHMLKGIEEILVQPLYSLPNTSSKILKVLKKINLDF